MSVRYSVIIPVKNREKSIGRCIESLLKEAPDPAGREIIVVDCASTDATIDITRRYPVKILQLAPDWPHSPAAARYTGSLSAAGEYLFFIDSDMTLEPGFLAQALKLLQTDTSIAGVSGICREIYYANDSPCGFNENLYKSPPVIQPVQFLGGAAVYRAQSLRDAGNFNPFLHAAEEFDLGSRLRAAGHKLMSIPVAMIIHHTAPLTAWTEFRRKKHVLFFFGIGQSLAVAASPAALVERLIYYHQYALFLFVLSYAGILCAWTAFSRNFYLCAATVISLLAIFLMRALRTHSIRQAGVSVVKWLIICFDITRGIFSPRKNPNSYPSTPPSIVMISPIAWDFLKQRHQIFASFLAHNCRALYYIENLNPTCGIKDLNLHKIASRFGITARRAVQKTNNLHVIKPLLIPSNCRLAEWVNRKFFIRKLAADLDCKGIASPVIWTYLATSRALELMNLLKPSSVVYDCVFDALEHPYSPPDIRQTESMLLQKADLVLTDNDYLYERCRAINKNTALLRPGVDMQRFADPMPTHETAGLISLPGPRLCFFGGIDSIRLDFVLLLEIAKARPHWSIFLCGPVIKTDISPLKRHNILFYPAIDYDKLPEYLQNMDILILPYAISAFTRSICPAKTYECLATGKPIVATPLIELRQLPAGLIRFGATADEFIRAVEDALAHDTPQAREQRINEARKNTWARRFDELQQLIETHAIIKRTNA